MNRLAPYAAEVAPHVDRLVIAVHHQIRVVHPKEAAAWKKATGLERAGLLINLRPFIIAGCESEETLRRLHRYAQEPQITASISAARGAGLLEADAFKATDKARDLAMQLTELQRSVMDELWARRPELAVLIEPLNRLADDIPARYPGRGFELARLFGELPRPIGSDAFLVHHLLTKLRYLRADCHAEVLDEAELGPTEAIVLTEAWQGVPLEHPMRLLVERGLLNEDGTITDEGRSFRDAIEDETNSSAAGIWEVLDDDTRAAVLEALTTLDHERSHAVR